jgi:hypothetical protein
LRTQPRTISLLIIVSLAINKLFQILSTTFTIKATKLENLFDWRKYIPKRKLMLMTLVKEQNYPLKVAVDYYLLLNNPATA